MNEDEAMPVDAFGAAAIRNEMQRIRALFVKSPDDAEDLITYAKEIVRLRTALQGTDTVTEAITDEMINAGGSAVVKSAHLTGCERARLIYTAMRAAAPTAQDDNGVRLEAVWDELQCLLPQTGVGAELESAWDRLQCLLRGEQPPGASGGE